MKDSLQIENKSKSSRTSGFFADSYEPEHIAVIQNKPYGSGKSKLPLELIKAISKKKLPSVQIINTETASENEIILELIDVKVNIDFRFSEIADEIEASKYILELEQGWDGENAEIIKSEIWKAATKFLINAALEINKEYSVIIQTPEINPVKDGSIDLSWRTEKARMLINVRERAGEMVANYYGDFYNNEKPRKGSDSLDSNIEDLVVWMRNLV